jgi:hypothetical protein
MFPGFYHKLCVIVVRGVRSTNIDRLYVLEASVSISFFTASSKICKAMGRELDEGIERWIFDGKWLHVAKTHFESFKVLTSSSTHSLYDAYAFVLISLNPSFCAAPPSGQLSLMNCSAFSRLLDPIAATTCATSEASRSAVGRTKSRVNEPEIASDDQSLIDNLYL